MIIVLNGYPGVGKLTIGQELISRISGRLLDIHSVYNVAFALTEFKSPEFIDTVEKIEAIAHDLIRKLPAEMPVVLTTVLAGSYGRDPITLHDFEERCTALLVQTGLPRMTARVLACLVITDGSVTAADLVQRLQVSPASISKAIGLLEEQKLVRLERSSIRRREEYTIDDDVWFQSWLASARMNALLSDMARQGADIPGLGTPAGTRLQDMAQFLDHVGRDMVEAAERWRKVLSARRTADH